jgi:histidinol-phosphate aminotransferase
MLVPTPTRSTASPKAASSAASAGRSVGWIGATRSTWSSERTATVVTITGRAVRRVSVPVRWTLELRGVKATGRESLVCNHFVDSTMARSSTSEKGGTGFEGITLLLCENPLPPIDEAIQAATAAVPESNHYTEPYSNPLREALADRLAVPTEHLHVNAGSELILRQLFDRLGEQVHLLTPTYPLFYEIAESYTETRLRPEDDFAYDLADLEVPPGTTLVVIVNPNNPNGGGFDVDPLPDLLADHPDTHFLVDEAFVDFHGESVAGLVPDHDNLLVTRTFSKAHSLAGFRVGYAVLPDALAADLNASNDAYPLSRPGQAAALATLRNEATVRERVETLTGWADDLAAELEALGVRTFPTETYFFLADFTPHAAGDVADGLRERGVYVKPLDDDRLGPGYVRVTTALPAENERVLAALEDVL